MESVGPSPNLTGDHESGSQDVKDDNAQKTKRKQRKKKSAAKSFTKPKQRGRYNPKSSKFAEEENISGVPTIGIGDNELAECLCSDDEVMSEYLKDVNIFLPPRENVEECTDEAPMGNIEDCTDKSSLPIQDASGLDSQDSNIVSNSTSFFVEGGDESDLLSPAPTSSYAQSGTEDFSSCEEHSTTSMQSPTVFSSVLSTSESGRDEQTEENANSSTLSSALPEHPGLLASPEFEESVEPPQPSKAVLNAVLEKLKEKLPPTWVPIAERSGIHVLQLSRKSPKAIQKEIYMSYDGSVENVSVHLVLLPSFSDGLKSVVPPCTKLDESTLDNFCKRGLNIVQRLNQYSVCIGANDEFKKDVWHAIPDAYVDENLFKEESYESTCRSSSCERLVLFGRGPKKRCPPCAQLMKNLRRKGLHTDNVSSSSKINYRYMTNEEKMRKMYEQREEIRKRDKKIEYLTKQLNALLEDEGVDVDTDLSEDLTHILAKSKLSPLQQIFLEEQVKQSQRADARGHRWHPTMIRLSLHLYMKSRSTFESLRDSGMVRLPCSRTLHDYSHAFNPQPGVNEAILKDVAQKNSKLKPHQQFVNLIADEMHCSRNLVYRQSDGALIGYAHMDELDKELSRFEECIKGEPATQKIHLANTILAYMVKGITSDVKQVVAAYPCNQLTKDMLYSRTWHVISRLERAGVKVLSMTSDGCAVNRAFIAMHEPITKTTSGVIFDTLNFCTKDERPLYFVADVAHLLKTIRNCFHNSGVGEKKPRCLEINGEKIVWATIIRLYLQHKQCTFRKSYKLNSQNVFPNSYSCMKVRLAAEVLSETVALDIEQQNWPNTTETVRFIRLCNKFFDCLNGAHSSQHIKTKNADLKPYTEESDTRFEWLEGTFLKYVEDWRAQAKSLKIPTKEQDKKMLSSQTQSGIEMAIKGFAGATKYLMRVAKESGDTIFIMARAFSQDHLENYFSRQRGACGGSTNPNAYQFFSHQTTLALQRDLGVAQKRGNVEDLERFDVMNESLPKRPQKRQKRISEN